MKRKLFPLVLAIAAVAAVVSPAGASAYLYSGGVKVPVGTGIVSSDSVSEFQFSGGGGFTCTSSSFGGNVYKNEQDLTRLELNWFGFFGTGSGQACTTSTSGTWKPTIEMPGCLVAHEEGLPGGAEWNLSKRHCNEGQTNGSMTIQSSLYGTCHYKRLVAFYFATESSSPSKPLVLKPNFGSKWAEKDSGSAFCPASIKFTGSWELKTAAGAATWLS